MKKIYLHFLHCAAGYAGVCRKFSPLVTCMKFNYISLFWCLHDVFFSAPPYDGESEKFLVCKCDPKPVLTKTKPDAIAPIQQTRQMEHLSGKQPWRANISFFAAARLRWPIVDSFHPTSHCFESESVEWPSARHSNGSLPHTIRLGATNRCGIHVVVRFMIQHSSRVRKGGKQKHLLHQLKLHILLYYWKIHHL